MIVSNSDQNLIKKDDLKKDYINFLLVMILSLFLKFDTKELAESIWFYSVVLADSMLLFQLIKCFEYDNFAVDRLASIVLTGIYYTVFYVGGLVGIRDIFGFGDLPLRVRDFIVYIPYIPFLLYAKREYFKEFVWQNKDNLVSLIVFLTSLKIVILCVLIHYLQQYKSLSFMVIYILFFFPFVKTYKFLTQKKGVK